MNEFLERISKLSPKRLALLAAELNSSLERLKRQTAQPIAIIGMGCRFPGGANDPESFWKLLIEGREGVSDVPPDRWDIESLYDPNPDSPGKMSTRRGGFLCNVDRFDPEFFGISPREAAGMDPQQRLLLEVAWEALENAGQSPEELAGTRTGVFAGVCNSDYYALQCEGGSESSDIYAATGNAHSVVSGRISYVLGLVGPSVSVDTSCSASLVAVHLACQSLRLSECGMALAGGVNLIIKPDVTVTLSRAHMMSPDGRCKAFDAAADGFVRAEGCGMVVLKRLSDARNDGDRILAVIRGTACNQDGRSSGLTAPNGPSQVALIRDALANAGLQPADIEFIEAHGTGTSLGDPVEAGALADVFGPGRRAENPLQIGSVKTNIGHAESAAGIAGLIKAVLALQHERIPASLHFNKLNPAIEWDVAAIRVTAKESKWNSEKGRRAAGVSSFGFSGTNAHVIVSDVIEDEAIPIVAGTDLFEPRFHLLPLSARTEPALVALAREYEQVFMDRPELKLADACYTAGAGRSHFAHRLAVIASNVGEASDGLAKYGRGERSAQILSGYAKSAGAPGVVFMFTGQGSQYVGMGRELYETQPVFRRELDRCAEILKPKLQRPLLEVMFGGTDADNSSKLLDETQYTQPALFALEYALAALWRSWGIEPAAVLGHSVGEYVAACVAGVLSLEDALVLIADRGRLMQALTRDGAMAALFASEERVRAAIDGRYSSISIAAVNSPRNTVISGNAKDVEAVLERLRKEGVEGARLAVSHAFHSALIDPMLHEFEMCARSVQHKAPATDLVQNETGCVLDRNSPLDAGYWRRHARGTVRFAQSIETLRARGLCVFLEIGPAPVLIGMARQCGDVANAAWLGSLRRDREASSEMLASLGALYALGHNPNWRAIQGAGVRRRLALPTYPFQRQRHWLSTGRTKSQATGKQPLAGDSVRIAPGEGVSESCAEFDDWLYEVRWVPRGESAIGRGRRPATPGTWLLLAGTQEAAAPWREALQSRGQRVLTAMSEQNSGDVGSVSEGYRLSLREALANNGALRGVLHLGGVEDSPLSDDADLGTLEASVRRNCMGALAVTRALARENSTELGRLWLVTRGALPTATPSFGLDRAPLWGLGRTIAVEHPEFWGGLIDVADVDATSIATAVDQLLTPGGENELAIAGEDVRVGRLMSGVKPAQVTPAPPCFRDNVSYLVTGGFGGIGRRVLEWMAEKGARYIVIVERSIDPSNPDEIVAKLVARGVNVLPLSADVSDDVALGLVFKEIEARYPKLAGVFHIAGAFDDCRLTEYERLPFERILKPKVSGGWNLHQLTKRLSLDCFVLFSSASTFLPSAKLGNYVAGNTFLDGLAHFRRARGLAAVSIDWGLWQNLGMATSLSDRRWAQTGFENMTPEQCLAALEYLMRDAPPQVGVLALDWAKYLERFDGAPPPLYAEMQHRVQEATFSSRDLATPERSVGLDEGLRDAAPDERRRMVAAFLCEHVAKVMVLDVSQPIDTQRPLIELGLDSLMALELRNAVASGLKCTLAVRALLNYPSIDSLAEYICTVQWLGAQGPSSATHSDGKRECVEI